MPRVDRIILTLTPNLVYTPYWNLISRIWQTKFDVKPTLIFNGTQAEQRICNLSTAYGEIIRLDPVPDTILNRQRDWSCTWSLFYGATLFPNEYCLLSGIDQMPLGGMFFNAVRALEDQYCVGFSDAYQGVYYPSSHHLARGSKFKSVLQINDDWPTEVRKVFATRAQWLSIDPHDMWGLDELYSSALLRLYRASDSIILLNLFYHQWKPARLEPDSIINSTVLTQIAEDRHSEWHMPRPLKNLEQGLLDAVEKAIPVYKWT